MSDVSDFSEAFQRLMLNREGGDDPDTGVTTREIARELGVNVKSVTPKLQALFEQGRCKAGKKKTVLAIDGSIHRVPTYILIDDEA